VRLVVHFRKSFNLLTVNLTVQLSLGAQRAVKIILCTGMTRNWEKYEYKH